MPKSLLLLLLLVSACHHSTSVAPVTNTDLLTARPWRLSAYTTTTFAAGTTTTTDAYAAMPACAHDDFLTFQRDNTLLLDEGPTRCTPTLPQTETRQWLWQDDEKSLVTSSTSGYAGTTKYEVVALSATTLRLRTVQAVALPTGGTDTLTQDWTYSPL